MEIARIEPAMGKDFEWPFQASAAEIRTGKADGRFSFEDAFLKPEWELSDPAKGLKKDKPDCEARNRRKNPDAVRINRTLGLSNSPDRPGL